MKKTFNWFPKKKSNSVTPILPSPSPSYQATIIVLHYLGCTVNETVTKLLVWAAQKKLPYNIKFVFPQAPDIRFDYDGKIKKGWYNIISIEDLKENSEDDRGLFDSIEWIEELIKKEIDQGIPSQNIFIAGISQGGSVALSVAMTSQYKLGGFVALGSFLPYPKILKQKEKGNNKTVPIFMSNGQADKTVPFEMAWESFQTLKKNGYRIEFEDNSHNPNMGHRLWDFSQMIHGNMSFWEKSFQTRNLPKGNNKLTEFPTKKFKVKVPKEIKESGKKLKEELQNKRFREEEKRKKESFESGEKNSWWQWGENFANEDKTTELAEARIKLEQTQCELETEQESLKTLREELEENKKQKEKLETEKEELNKEKESLEIKIEWLLTVLNYEPTENDRKFARPWMDLETHLLNKEKEIGDKIKKKQRAKKKLTKKLKQKKQKSKILYENFQSEKSKHQTTLQKKLALEQQIGDKENTINQQQVLINQLQSHVCSSCQLPHCSHNDYEEIRTESTKFKDTACLKEKEHEQKIFDRIISELELTTEKDQENILETIISEIKVKLNPPTDNQENKVSELTELVEKLKREREKPTQENIEKITEFTNQFLDSKYSKQLKSTTSYRELLEVYHEANKEKVTFYQEQNKNSNNIKWILGATTTLSTISLFILAIVIMKLKKSRAEGKKVFSKT